VQAVTLAISYRLENITELMSPLAILKQRLERSEIIAKQKAE
jgi:hypothetical protein